ncbi:hypothetical protein [Nonomuraea fuscirosea]|uniref:hypothetical protein n=1 Tax=Nonomuraea fuscirosea TaxID=1291556 RepID=UPI0034090534
MGRPPSLAPTSGRVLPERTAIRHALDDLTARRLPPADAERIADAQLDSEIEAERAPRRDRLVPAGRRRVPRARPRLGRGAVDGFRPQDS